MRRKDLINKHLVANYEIPNSGAMGQAQLQLVALVEHAFEFNSGEFPIHFRIQLRFAGWIVCEELPRGS